MLFKNYCCSLINGICNYYDVFLKLPVGEYATWL